jgi:hypothetical protein
MTEVGTRDIPPLNWNVLVTRGIPIATSDLPPVMKQAMFQAIASTLIYGKQDTVLVHTYMTVKQTDAYDTFLILRIFSGILEKVRRIFYWETKTVPDIFNHTILLPLRSLLIEFIVKFYDQLIYEHHVE